MNRILSLLPLIIICKTLNAQHNSLLWKISGNGLPKTSYLYGTMHSYDARAHQFGDSVLPALNRCEAVAVEFTGGDTGDKKEMLKMVFMKDKSVEDLLGTEDYAFVKEKVIERLGTAGMFFNKMKPIFTLALLSAENGRKEMPSTVDEYFKTLAKDNSKTLIGLESTEDLQRSLDRFELKEQATMLLSYLKKSENDKGDFESLMKAYQTQDLDQMYTLYSKEKDLFPSMETSLLLERNQQFFDRLKSQMQKQSTFCAVGALHLPGPSGLINTLKQKGYKVEPVYSRHTAKPTVLNDNRPWYNYENDSVTIGMQFPEDPDLETTYTDSTHRQISMIAYNYYDSIFDMRYSVSVNPLAYKPKQLQKYYDTLATTLASLNEWELVKHNQRSHSQQYPLLDAEYYISKGINCRLLAIVRGDNLYMISVTAAKQKLYSNVADKFFEGCKFLNPKVFVSLTIKNSLGQDFKSPVSVAIKSAGIDTTFIYIDPTDIGFSLPNVPDTTILTVSSKGYVSKKVALNTLNLYRTALSEVEINGEVTMLKMGPGVNPQLYKEPVAIARLLADGNFAWDQEYIARRKRETQGAAKPPAAGK